MKKLLLAGAAIFALCSASAMAADVPVKMPYKAAPAAPVFNWSGFYVGGNVGYGWASKDWNTGPISMDPKGVVGGGQIGVNWQSGVWVFGIEGAGDWADLRNTTSCPNPAFNCRSKVDGLASVTGRIGYAWNTALLYVKGGGGWSFDKYDVHLAATGAFTAAGSETRGGWTVGVGYEYAFSPNWSARIEYDYYGFGSRTLTFTDASLVRIRENVQTVTVGLNYKFDWGKSPVVAKY
jgi:outer membrane immunogenic protein